MLKNSNSFSVMFWKKNHGSWLQYVGPKSCSLQYVVQKITLWGGGAMVKDWFLNVEVRSSNPHTCNIGYLGYLDDLIR